MRIDLNQSHGLLKRLNYIVCYIICCIVRLYDWLKMTCRILEQSTQNVRVVMRGGLLCFLWTFIYLMMRWLWFEWSYKLNSRAVLFGKMGIYRMACFCDVLHSPMQRFHDFICLICIAISDQDWLYALLDTKFSEISGGLLCIFPNQLFDINIILAL